MIGSLLFLTASLKSKIVGKHLGAQTLFISQLTKTAYQSDSLSLQGDFPRESAPLPRLILGIRNWQMPGHIYIGSPIYSYYVKQEVYANIPKYLLNHERLGLTFTLLQKYSSRLYDCLFDLPLYHLHGDL